MHFTLAVAANNDDLLRGNLLASPCLAPQHGNEVIVQRGFPSAALAYNDAIAKSSNDLIVFAHQDIYFPEPWIKQLERSLDILEVADPKWGVLGCYGTTVNGDYRGYLYSSSQGVHGSPSLKPLPVQTLDEIVLVIRRSSGLEFDPNLPNFHLYGADICLAASARGMASYAICAPCIHNNQQNLILPTEFYECCEHIRSTRKAFLPIQTPCIRITKSKGHIYRRRLHEVYLRCIRRQSVGGRRVQSIDKLVGQFAMVAGRQ